MTHKYEARAQESRKCIAHINIFAKNRTRKRPTKWRVHHDTPTTRNHPLHFVNLPNVLLRSLEAISTVRLGQRGNYWISRTAWLLVTCRNLLYPCQMLAIYLTSNTCLVAVLVPVISWIRTRPGVLSPKEAISPNLSNIASKCVGRAS